MKLKNKGIVFGLSSAIFWSFNTIILSILLQGKNIYFLPLFFAFLHDFFSSIYLYINLIRLKYKVKFVEGYDMFPQTYHIETLVLLEK